jgi:hypothetical protein
MMRHEGARGVNGGSLLHLCPEAIPSRVGHKGKVRNSLLEGRGMRFSRTRTPKDRDSRAFSSGFLPACLFAAACRLRLFSRLFEPLPKR